MVPRLALRALYALKIVIDSRKSGFSDGLPPGRDRRGKKHLFGKGETGWIEDYMTTQESLRRDVGKITSPCSRGYVGT